MKHTPTPIIWVCPRCGFMSKTKYWAHITPKIDDSRTFDCNDNEGKPQEMIPYVPKSTHDELLEAAKVGFKILEDIQLDGEYDLNEEIEILYKAIQKASEGEHD